MQNSATFQIGRIDFDASAGELRSSARTRRLEPKAAAVLQLLCEHQGAVVSRQDFLDRCWGEGQGSDEALTQAVAQVRRALQDLGESDVVDTLARRGYRLKAGSIALERAALRDWRRFIFPAAAAAAAAVLILVVAFPHSARHSIRHALGLGPSAASTQTH